MMGSSHDETRAELHARAAAFLAARAEAGDGDARTVVSYYRSCVLGADRAAEQLVMFARARGLARP